ncbi:MAG: DUF4350 domain-containing protein [Gemmataceae bacterium]
MSRAAGSRLLSLSGILALWLVGPGCAWLSAQVARPEVDDGTHVFRAMLREMKLEALDRKEQALRAPAQTIVIIFGERRVLPLTWQDIEQIVSQGGALLLASDHPGEPYPPNSLGLPVVGTYPRWGGIRVSGQTWDPERMLYRQSGNCPKVLPRAGTPCPIFRGLDAVATNRPNYLVPIVSPRSRWERLADLPPLGENPRPLFAVAAERNPGRIVQLADHSVFINEMLLQDDNDNFDLAYNCLQWLAAGRRSQVLFIEEGRIVTDFDMLLEDMPLPPTPPLPPLNELGNHLLNTLQERDVFHRMLFENATPRQINRWLRNLFVLATLVLVIYGLVRVLRGRFHPEKQLPPLAVHLAQASPSAAFVRQRQQELLSRGNLWEAARDLARHCFTQAPPAPPDQPPRVTTRGNWWQRWRRRRLVARLWRLAWDDQPQPISPRAFARLARRVRGLQSALAAGTLRWDEDQTLSHRDQA